MLSASLFCFLFHAAFSSRENKLALGVEEAVDEVLPLLLDAFNVGSAIEPERLAESGVLLGPNGGRDLVKHISHVRISVELICGADAMAGREHAIWWCISRRERHLLS